MASNRRRSQRSASARARSTGNVRTYATAGVQGAAPASTAAPGKAPSAVDWQAEYGFVMGDLRYLGLVSLSLFLLLLVIGFFL